MHPFPLVLRRSIFAATRPRLAVRSPDAPPHENGDTLNDYNLGDDIDILDLPPLPEGSYPPPKHPSNPLALMREKTRPFRSDKLPKYRLHVHSTRNNTITTFTRPDGNTLAWFSGGSCGFKKGNRATYEAGYQCAVKMFERIQEEAKSIPMMVELYFKGFGQGRDALHRALLSTEGQMVRPMIASITDRTPIKIGGTRAPKRRRLWCVNVFSQGLHVSIFLFQTLENVLVHDSVYRKAFLLRI